MPIEKLEVENKISIHGDFAAKIVDLPEVAQKLNEVIDFCNELDFACAEELEPGRIEAVPVQSYGPQKYHRVENLDDAIGVLFKFLPNPVESVIEIRFNEYKITVEVVNND